MMAQPTVYRMLTEVGMDRYDLSSITNFAVGGEKLSPDLAQKVTAQTGHVLYEGYAQSEAGLIAAASKAPGPEGGVCGENSSQVPCRAAERGRHLCPARGRGGDHSWWPTVAGGRRG